jgi:hypothetical protein
MILKSSLKIVIYPLYIFDEMNDNLLGVFIKLFIVLYADDTVIFSETREEMQNMLDVFYRLL